MSMHEPEAPFLDEFGDDPSPRSEPYREKVADALHAGADKGREWSERGPERASRPIRTASDGLDSAAEYIESHDLVAMCDDAFAWTKRNPGAAIALAAAAGFCIAVAMLRSEPRRV